MPEPEPTRGSGVDREFLGWDAPLLPAVAERLASRYTRGAEIRLEQATVVVPGARGGRRLKELLVDVADARGHRLVPPRITTVGYLPELIYSPRLEPAGDTLSRRIWAMALRGLDRDSLRIVFPEPPAPTDLLGWMRLARTVHSLHREITGAGVRFQEVGALCDDGLLFADSERWEVLGAAEMAYEKGLTALGFGDSGLQRIAALNGGTLASETDLWLCGVAEMPRVTHRMLTRLGESHSTRITALVHAPPSEAGSFDPLGCVLTRAWMGRPVPLDDARLAVCGRPGDQADEVVRTLSRLDGAFAADEIVLSVPDAELTPFLEQRLTSARVPVHLGEGTAVERSRPVQLLAALAEFSDGRSSEALAALARHPDLAGWLKRGRIPFDAAEELETSAARREAGFLESLDRFLSNRLPARVPPLAGAPEPVATEEESGRQRRALLTVRRLRAAIDDGRMLGGLAGRRRLAEWAPLIVGLLVEVYHAEGTRLDGNIPENRRLLDALQAVKEAATELHALPAAADEPCDAASAIRILLDALQGRSLTPTADDAAVELLGWLEVHLDDSPVVVVTGFNEGALPESTGAHAFLPNALRSKLGLVDNDRRYARDAYQLTALLHSREHVHVIAGRRTAKGDPLRPSRLMLAVPGESLARRVQRFYGDRADEAGQPARSAAGSGVEPTSRFVLPPEQVLSSSEPISVLSVSRFRNVLADPYLFALEHVLGLRALNDHSRELDGLSFGNLAHAVLEVFGRSASSRSTNETEIREFLYATLREMVEVRYGSHAFPAVRLQIEQLRVRLGAFAKWQASWSAEGWSIAGVECETDASGVSFSVDDLPFGISGRIDRIDHHPVHGWAVFDYKTGDAGDSPEKTHRKGKEKRWIDLQLPLYRHLLPSVLDRDGRSPFSQHPESQIQLGYILLPGDPEVTGACFAEWDDSVLEDADQVAREVVRIVRRNHFDFDRSAVSPKQAGDFAALLGIGYLQAADDDDDDEEEPS